MLFESFDVTIIYQDKPLDFTVQERYGTTFERAYEIIQGGISIIQLSLIKGEWQVNVVPGLHPVVMHDTEVLLRKDFLDLLITTIISHYSQKSIQFSLF